MGMFDYIKVELDLPDGGKDDGDFQTKSLDCLMDNYIITAKGELYKDEWDCVWEDDPTHFLGGYIRQVEGSYRRKYLTDFSHDIIFYDGRRNDGKWRNYIAEFKDGKLVTMRYEDVEY